MPRKTVLHSAIPFLFFLGCGGTPPTMYPENDSNILVTLSGLPARAISVVVSATLDGKPAMATDTYTPPPSSGQFGVSLPPAVAGTLKLSVNAADVDGCVQGAGDLTTTLPSPQRLDANLPLILKVPRQCGTLAPCPINTICPDTLAITQGIRGMWTISPSDIWAVGDAGLIMHYNGSAWAIDTTTTTKDLKGVWASGANDVWAVGATGTMLHYTGGTWTSSLVGARDLKGIWGSSPTEIWAVGEVTLGNAVLRHYTGTSWLQVNTALSAITVNAVYTSAPDFVYACGLDSFGGLLLRWNGVSWSKPNSYSADELRAFWGSGRTNLVVVGDYGSISRYNDPTGWEYVNTASNLAHLYAVTGDAQKTIYAMGDNGTIYRMDAPYLPSGPTVYKSTSNFLRAVSFGSNGIGWVGGTSGFLGHMDLRP